MNRGFLRWEGGTDRIFSPAIVRVSIRSDKHLPGSFDWLGFIRIKLRTCATSAETRASPVLSLSLSLSFFLSV
jgi:hypothetical protein